MTALLKFLAGVIAGALVGAVVLGMFADTQEGKLGIFVAGIVGAIGGSVVGGVIGLIWAMATYAKDGRPPDPPDRL
jgi:hypothetical protein